MDNNATASAAAWPRVIRTAFRNCDPQVRGYRNPADSLEQKNDVKISGYCLGDSDLPKTHCSGPVVTGIPPGLSITKTYENYLEREYQRFI
ncbi:hypothetical protein T10_362 [Trichinella papuae]|uniref:Uncharacterized protein n=1 Tax=Trichinella papuae TaxID=268474 RepID=A0A0V1MT37_9BILA|nr:hypothetical protein T10_362 [Trichinella papuae]